MAQYEVFISYSFEDKEFVEALENFLSEHGILCWYAQSKVKSGVWRKDTEFAIRYSSSFVLVISHSSENSDEVRKECEVAMSLGKEIYPIFLDDCKAPYNVADLQRSEYSCDADTHFSNTLTFLNAVNIKRRERQVRSIKRSRDFLSVRLDRFIPLRYETIYEGVSAAKDSYGSDLENLVERVMREVDPSEEDMKFPDEDISLLNGPFSAKSGDFFKSVVITGAPGAGKSTTLQKLFEEMALLFDASDSDVTPIFVHLRNYSGRKPLRDYLKSVLEQRNDDLAFHLDELLSSAKIALFLDGLNEAAQDKVINERARQVVSFSREFPAAFLAVTCLASEYTSERDLGINLVQISPLSPIQIKKIISNYCDTDSDSDRIFWSLVDDEKAPSYLSFYLEHGGTEADFWLNKGLCPVQEFSMWQLWKDVRDNEFSLLSLASNTFLLVIIITIFNSNRKPTSNRFDLFSMFFDIVFGIHLRTDGTKVIQADKEELISSLSLISRVMNERQTLEIARSDVIEMIGVRSEEFLSLAEDQKILNRGGGISFTHQLFRAFFGCFWVEKLWDSEEDLPGFPTAPEWWQNTMWDEAIVFLVGKHGADPIRLLSWLRDVSPELTSRCIVESGCRTDDVFLNTLATAWISRLSNLDESPPARAAIGRALGRLKADTRPGVSHVDEKNSIPVVEWMRIPQKEFEFSSHKVKVSVASFSMTKFMITNAQFEPFISDGGYSEKHRDCWTTAGWRWKELRQREGPDDYTEIFRLSNHPRIGTIWYEVHAYANWLTKRLRDLGQLGSEEVVRLPTEQEWESASRGPKGEYLYPWGDEFHYSKCNIKDIRSTSAVGIYPDAASAEGVHDLVGNAWSWCLTKWHEDPTVQDNGPEGESHRVYRGGSWAFDYNVSRWREDELRCDQRYWIRATDDRPDAIGFFLVRGEHQH